MKQVISLITAALILFIIGYFGIWRYGMYGVRGDNVPLRLAEGITGDYKPGDIAYFKDGSISNDTSGYLVIIQTAP